MGYSPSTIPHFRRSPEYLSPKNSAVLSSRTSNANCRTIIIYSFLKNNRDFLTLSPQISKNFWNLSDFETFFNLYFAKSKKDALSYRKSVFWFGLFSFSFQDFFLHAFKHRLISGRPHIWKCLEQTAAEETVFAGCFVNTSFQTFPNFSLFR